MKKSIKRECRNLILDTELHQDFLDNLDSYYQPIEDVIMGIYDACENDYFVNGLGEKTPYRDEHFCELMCTQYEEAFYNSDAVKDASYEVGGRMVREWAIIIWDNRILMHKANGDYNMDEDRYLYRIMIQNEL